MKIYLEKEDKEIEYQIKKNEKVQNILKKLNINISSCIVIKNNEIILEDEIVSQKDEIKILNVVSGG